MLHVFVVESRVRPVHAGSAPSPNLETPRAPATGTSDRPLEAGEEKRLGLTQKERHVGIGYGGVLEEAHRASAYFMYGEHEMVLRWCVLVCSCFLALNRGV